MKQSICLNAVKSTPKTWTQIFRTTADITYIVNSSDTALDKSEIEVIQGNNGARRAPATSDLWILV